MLEKFLLPICMSRLFLPAEMFSLPLYNEHVLKMNFVHENGIFLDNRVF